MTLLRQVHHLFGHPKHGKAASDKDLWEDYVLYAFANKEAGELPWLDLSNDALAQPFSPVLTRWLYTLPALRWVLTRWDALLIYSAFQKDACDDSDWQKPAWGQVHKMMMTADMRLTCTFLHEYYTAFLEREFYYAMGKPRNAVFQTHRVLQRDRVLREAAADPEIFFPETFKAIHYLLRPATDESARCQKVCLLDREIDTYRMSLLEAESSKRLTPEQAEDWKRRIIAFTRLAVGKNAAHSLEWTTSPGVLAIAATPPAGEGECPHDRAVLFARAMLESGALDGDSEEGAGDAGAAMMIVPEGRKFHEIQDDYSLYMKMLKDDLPQVKLYLKCWGLDSEEMKAEWRAQSKGEKHISDGTCRLLKKAFDDLFANTSTNNQIVEHDFSIADTCLWRKKMGQKTFGQWMMFSANKKQDFMASEAMQKVGKEGQQEREVRAIGGEKNSEAAKKPLTIMNPDKRDVMIMFALQDSKALDAPHLKQQFCEYATLERQRGRGRQCYEYKGTAKLAQQKNRRWQLAQQMGKCGATAYQPPVPVLHKKELLTQSQYNKAHLEAHAEKWVSSSLIPGKQAATGGRHECISMEALMKRQDEKKKKVEKAALRAAKRADKVAAQAARKRKRGGGGGGGTKAAAVCGSGGGQRRRRRTAAERGGGSCSSGPAAGDKEVEVCKLKVQDLKEELQRRGWRAKGVKLELAALLTRARGGEEPTAEEKDAPSDAARQSSRRHTQDKEVVSRMEEGDEEDNDDDDNGDDGWDYARADGTPCSQEEWRRLEKAAQEAAEESSNSEVDDAEDDDDDDADTVEFRQKVRRQIQAEVEEVENDEVVRRLNDKGVDAGGETMQDVVESRRWKPTQVRAALVDLLVDEKVQAMADAPCENCGVTETVDEQLDPLLFCDGCNRVYCLACIRHLDETNPVLECLELALQCPCCSGNHCYEGAFSS
jgi:hypothetical protein